MRDKAVVFRKHLRWICLMIIILFGIITFISCGGGDDNDDSGSSSGITATQEGISGTINTDNYIIAAGETVNVAGDLTINATQGVNIAGELIANGDHGQKITINAGTEVEISGKVTAGNGGIGQNGGDLTIASDSGNIILTETSFISSGNGAEGTADFPVLRTVEYKDDTVTAIRTVEGGKGADGGSVILKAPNGSITIPYIEGIIRIGNGGNGAAIIIGGQELFTTQIPSQLTNGGGDSGGLILDSPNIIGVLMDTLILEKDHTDPKTGVTYRAGDEIPAITDAFQFSGGVGGNAGDLYFGIDQDGNSTWPVTETSAFIAGLDGTGYLRNENSQMPPVEVTGDKGGDGFTSPGDGQSLNIKGQNASEPGQDGQDVRATGGNGGDCRVFPWTWIFCTDGSGGNAIARGGDGAKGSDPNGSGGSGGDAYAKGGLSGYTVFYSAKGGDAYAYGGKGGDGGNGCIEPYISYYGGRGGSGGYANASSEENWTTEYGRAVAIGGNGGNGGRGMSSGGAGGSGGEAIATARQGYASQTNGNSGYSGGLCRPEESLRVDPSSITVMIGASAMFRALYTVHDINPMTHDMTNHVTWSSSNTGVANIGANGVAWPSGPGTTTISARLESANGRTLTASATLTVIAEEYLRTTPAVATKEVGDSQTFTALYSVNGVENIVSRACSWSSGNSSIATVDNMGNAVCVSAGATIIKATYNSPYQRTLNSSSNLTCVQFTSSPSGYNQCSGADPGVTFDVISYDGNPGWNDCGQESAWHSLVGSDRAMPDGTTLSDRNGHCVMQINCP